MSKKQKKCPWALLSVEAINWRLTGIGRSRWSKVVEVLNILGHRQLNTEEILRRYDKRRGGRKAIYDAESIGVIVRHGRRKFPDLRGQWRVAFWRLQNLSRLQVIERPTRPMWDRRLGRISFVLSKAKLAPQATSRRAVLDSFEDAAWSQVVASPFGDDAERLHKTLRNLRDQVPFLEFHSAESGRAVTWNRTSGENLERS